MMGYMKNLFVSFISFFLLSSLFGQREQPESLDTLGFSKYSKSTKCLNPEYLLFPSKPKGDEKPALLIYLHGAGGVGDDVRRLQGQARALLEGIKNSKKGLVTLLLRNVPVPERRVGEGPWEASDLDLC